MDKNFSKIKKNRLLASIRRSGSVKKGFSLIEVLVALLVLSVGIAAIAILMVKNIKDLQISKNQIIASMLAQEGIELVRNLKDNNKTTFISGPVPGKANGDNYTIDKEDALLSDFTTGGDQKLYLNSGFYTHNAAGTPTKFSRKIKIYNYYDPANNIAQVEVTSYVSWNVNGIPTDCNIGNKCVSTISIMTDK